MATIIYAFGGSIKNDDIEFDRDIVGGKGLGLQVMSKIGVDVPPGFTLPTTLCPIYSKHDDLPQEIWSEVSKHVERLEKEMGRSFGDKKDPLLFSVRSGAAISMPGMMDTVLNIGLNDDSVKGLAKATNNPRFAWDSYRRLLNMFGDVVRGIPHESFEERFDAIKAAAGVEKDVDLSADQLKELCDEYKAVFKSNGQEFPSDPQKQLEDCIKAVFGSWNSARAIKYREINGIKHLIGTAANVQTMVFGNMGSTSGTGVAFSRNPSTGENKLYGEFLINAQGEDVVAGIRTPEHISKMAEVLPEAYKVFVENIDKLERHFKDMQDVEFTVENGKLWMLQCRSGKRTGMAAIRIAVDLVNDGICTKSEAIQRVEPAHIKQLLHPNFTPDALKSNAYRNGVVAKGLAGGPGAAVGKLVFSTTKAEELKAAGENVILVRVCTSPEDVGGMWASAGILTSKGGKTSHAAVVARGWGKPCVCGCVDLEVDEANESFLVKTTGEIFKAGDTISINGSTGEVIRGAMEMKAPALEGELEVILEWCDEQENVLKVYANADSGKDSAVAAKHGAQGIGLCRTEHMFFSPDRLPVVQRWILRDEGLEKVEAFQRADFIDIFSVMDGKKVTIRLLDPPLHEFTPHIEEINEDMAAKLGYGSDVHKLIMDIESMHEENPMLGLRGCRLGIVHEDLTQMQVRAIMHAAADRMEAGGNPMPRIMVPLVGTLKEFLSQALVIKSEAESVKALRNLDIWYEIGTMIEVPRAALISDQLASLADPIDGKKLCAFFSYGTNDLTQMTMGISRDDSSAFIPKYMEKGILTDDPFNSIDVEGVGYLVKKSAVEGKAANPNLSLSVCGEQGGDPKSINFFDELGLDYVSCSPFRVPVARLAVGQAASKRNEKYHIKEKTHHDEWEDSALLGKFFHLIRLDKLPLWPFGHHRAPPKSLNKRFTSCFYSTAA